MRQDYIGTATDILNANVTETHVTNYGDLSNVSALNWTA